MPWQATHRHPHRSLDFRLRPVGARCAAPFHHQATAYAMTAYFPRCDQTTNLRSLPKRYPLAHSPAITTIGVQSSAALATPVAQFVRPGLRCRKINRCLTGHASISIRGMACNLLVSYCYKVNRSADPSVIHEMFTADVFICDVATPDAATQT